MTTPLRVAVVARAVWSLHGYGGLERSVRDLVRHLAALDVDVTLITPPPSAPDADRPFDPARVRLVSVPYVTFPMANRRGTTILDRSTSYLLFGERAGRAALALVRDGQLDVVHGFGASVLGYARQRRRTREGAAGGAATAPLVFNPQGLEEFGATRARQSAFKRMAYTPLRRAVRACARGADCVLATDEALEDTVTRHLGIPAAKRRTLPNGIDLIEASALAGPEDGARMRHTHGIDPDQLLFLSVGRLEHNKGFDVLARALGQARQRDAVVASRDWRWVLVGAGPHRPAIERAIARAGIGDRALLVGRASDGDLHGWYEAASIFVHPSRYEGSSLVTLEAMAHRCPVIATMAGGLPDKVKPGSNGWLVPADDAEALANAITEAARGDAPLAAMGARSRARVETTFAWPVLAERQIAIYRDLIGR